MTNMQPDRLHQNLSPKHFFDQLIMSFPELVGQFEDDDGEHYKMERFAQYSNDLIGLQKWDKLRFCFDFLEHRLNRLCPELENALNVSYCEALLLGEHNEKMNKVTDYMGPNLKRFYNSYEKYYEDLIKASKGK